MSQAAQDRTTDRIDPGTTVNQVVERFPQAVGVFKSLGIDSCCGGSVPLEVAAERGGVDVDRLLEALRRGTEELA